jgi:signal transduction histidine kinase/CheY-like chemotaxis protein
MVDQSTTNSNFSAEELYRLQVLGESLRNCAALQPACQILVDCLISFARLSDCTIFIREANFLTQIAVSDISSRGGIEVADRIGLPLGVGIVGGVALSREPEYVPDVSRNDRYVRDVFTGCSEYAVPMIHRGELIGVIDSESTQLDGFSVKTRLLMQAAADISAPNLAALQESQSERSARSYNEVIAELARLPVVSGGDVRASFAAITERVARTLRVPRAQLWLVGKETVECIDHFELANNRHHTGATLTISDHPLYFRALARERVLLARDCQRDPRTRSFNTLYSERVDIRSMLHAPIRVDGRVAAVLCVESRGEIRDWRDDEASFIGSLADFVTLTLLATQKSDAEAALVQAQRLEALGRLAGGIAHDFNNLLTVINGGVDLVLGSLGSDTDPTDLLRMVAQAGERAQKLTRQLLAFGRKQRLEIRVVNAADILRNVSELTQRVIPEDIHVEFHFTDRPQWVACDQDQLEQVVMNLMLNAADAMPKGGRLNVRQQGDEADSEVAITVEDSGSGISSDLWDTVFEPFFTTKGELGTGLGLSVSLGIMEQHGGSLRLLRSDTAGTEFMLRLPQQPEPAWPNTEIRITEPSGSGHAGGNVLLVEDEIGVRNVLTEMLTRLGYEPIVAKDAADALTLIQDRPIDLMITDVVMPDLRGPELYGLASAIKPGLKVLYISGYSEASLTDLPSGGESAGYLGKPFTLTQLEESLFQLLQGECIASSIQVELT